MGILPFYEVIKMTRRTEETIKLNYSTVLEHINSNIAVDDIDLLDDLCIWLKSQLTLDNGNLFGSVEPSYIKDNKWSSLYNKATRLLNRYYDETDDSWVKGLGE